MPSAEYIQGHLTGAWRLMVGQADGLRRLDLSSDGFWLSFFAMVVAAPALILAWVGIAHEIAPVAAEQGGRFFTIVRLAMVDLGTWVLPLVLLALLAPVAGISDRFVAYVVATNWASAIFAWMMLPVSLIAMAAPALGDIASGLSILIFIASLVLTWRLTHTVLAKGGAVATAVFMAMLVVSLIVLFSLQTLLGIGIGEPVYG